MAHSVKTPFRLDSYQLRLSSFEGPLDVLLRLIEREQLPVNEISLVSVLDQFMTYMSALADLPPDLIAEFATVACRLSVLKSRALLPKPAKSVEDSEDIDLVRQLEEYRAIKMAAELLAMRQRDGVGAFGPGVGIVMPRPDPPRLVPQPSSALARAVGRWVSRIPQRPTPLRPHRMISLWEMVSKVFQMLASGRPLTFNRLSEECQGRPEIAVAFLALLMLVRRRVVEVRQDSLFGSISIIRLSHQPLMPDTLGLVDSDESPASDKLYA